MESKGDLGCPTGQKQEATCQPEHLMHCGQPWCSLLPCSQKEQTVGEGNRIWTSIFQWINQTENLSHPFAVQVLQALRPLGPPGADESRLPALALNRPRQGRLLLKYICPASTPCHQTPDPCRYSASPQSSWKSHRTKKKSIQS